MPGHCQLTLSIGEPISTHSLLLIFSALQPTLSIANTN